MSDDTWGKDMLVGSYMSRMHVTKQSNLRQKKPSGKLLFVDRLLKHRCGNRYRLRKEDELTSVILLSGCANISNNFIFLDTHFILSGIYDASLSMLISGNTSLTFKMVLSVGLLVPDSSLWYGKSPIPIIFAIWVWVNPLFRRAIFI